MKPTLQDIANIVGVSKPTISVVLNNARGGVRVSEPTKQRIIDVAKRLNYHGNAAARALVTKKSGFISFLLSDTVADGLGNQYFAQYLAGIEHECRDRGYGLSVSLWNLSNIHEFVFPKKVGQRAVDGLILGDYVSAAIMEQFKQFDIPCVCLGENQEMEMPAPVISWDMGDGLRQAIDYLLKLGHQRVALALPSVPWFINLTHELETHYCSLISGGGLNLIKMSLPGVECDYASGKHLLDQWLETPEDQRPTAIITSDQACISIVSEMSELGLHCPADLSLISSCDSKLCEFAQPRLTALWRDMESLGRLAAATLLDGLDENLSSLPRSVTRLKSKLVMRKSCQQVVSAHRARSAQV